MRSVAIVVLVLLAGCAGPGGGETATPSSPALSPPPTGGTPTPPSPSPPVGLDDGWEPVGPPVEVTYHLTAQGTLALEAPPAGRLPADATLGDAITSIGAFPGKPWLAPPTDVAWQISGALLDAHIVIAADGGAQSAVSAAIEAADLYAWIGSDESFVTRNDEVGPAQLTPGATHAFDTFFFTPPGGLIIPAGGRLAMYALATYITPPENGIAYLVGGSDGTRITLRAQPIALAPEPPADAPLSFEGELEARPPAATQEGGNAAHIPLDLPFAERGIRAVVIEVEPVAQAAQRVDLDLFLLGPSGDAIFSSLSEWERERIVLLAPNALPDGPYTILVRNTSQVPGGYRLSVTIHAVS